jgi:hypothetical protein
MVATVTITLDRGDNTIELTPVLWDACQLLAKQAGWKPAGALDMIDQTSHSTYAPGHIILDRDAYAFAAALERAINGAKADTGELDLGALVAVVNFLRGGAFLIR